MCFQNILSPLACIQCKATQVLHALWFTIYCPSSAWGWLHNQTMIMVWVIYHTVNCYAHGMIYVWAGPWKQQQNDKCNQVKTSRPLYLMSDQSRTQDCPSCTQGSQHPQMVHLNGECCRVRSDIAVNILQSHWNFEGHSQPEITDKFSPAQI